MGISAILAIIFFGHTHFPFRKPIKNWIIKSIFLTHVIRRGGGGLVIASWEEQRDYNIGAAGFVVVRGPWQPVARVEFLHTHAKNHDYWAAFGVWRYLPAVFLAHQPMRLMPRKG
jgi:hypothetical protein